MELAFAQGADAVWILDDDSWPRAEALEALLEKPWDAGVVRHSLQIDPQTGRFTWPLQVADGTGGWRLVDSLDEMPAGDFVRSRIMWTGALVPREVREAVGPVNGELFIRGEDEEYPWRIEQAGFPQEAVRNAMMDHPGPDEYRALAVSREELVLRARTGGLEALLQGPQHGLAEAAPGRRAAGDPDGPVLRSGGGPARWHPPAAAGMGSGP